MDVDLSRRAAQVLMFPPLRNLGPEERHLFAHRISAAQGFDDLDEADQRAIIESEFSGTGVEGVPVTEFTDAGMPSRTEARGIVNFTPDTAQPDYGIWALGPGSRGIASAL